METILFTGARSGIAAQVIETIKHKDYHILVSVHNEKQLELVTDYYKKDTNIECIQLDITNPEDRERLEQYDIDILVNNAAIGMGGSMAEIPMQLVRNNFEVNVFSYFEIIQIVLKKMIQKKKGKIINMASLAGLVPIPFLGSYCATKASIIKMTETLRQELKQLHSPVTISLIEPGFYATGFNQVMFENKYDWMYLESYFTAQIQTIREKENFLLNILEKRNLNTIVKKIVSAIESENPKCIYRSPFGQVLGAKMYLLLKG